MEIRCTNCGANLPIENESDFISCTFCEAALFVDDNHTVTSCYIRTELPPDELSSAIALKLASMDIPPAHEILRHEMVFRPFWRFDTGSTKTLLISAADAPAFELAELYTPRGNPITFTPAAMTDHLVIEPNSSYQEARGRFESAWFDSHPNETRTLQSVVVSLAHLPVYHVTYVAAGQRYSTYVDGVFGNVYSDRWPPSSGRRQSMVLGAVGALVLTAFCLESLLIPVSLWLVMSYGTTVLLAYYAALFALQQLNPKGEA